MVNLITEHLNVWTAAQTPKTSGAGRSNGSGNHSLYGIKKLRELILELAVRGKLVPQDPNDEPAAVLLKKIAAEKARLVKEGKIKKQAPLPEIGEDEKPFDQPEGWEWVRLHDLGEWGAGATPLRGRREYYGGHIPWFKSGELIGDYISSSEEYVTDLALKETSLRYNKIGDVLIAMYGATIGKTSILEVPATTNQAVCACTPCGGIYNVFLLTALKAYKSRFIKMGAGGAQPNISREKIIATVFVLPPLAEQHRIVAKVDELMALCDQLERQQTYSNAAHQTLVEALLATLTNAAGQGEFVEAWQRIAAHFDTLFTTEYSIDQLKQTILQLAVMGKLVPQDPNDEPARILLKKIAVEKARLVKEGKIKKQTPLPEIREDEKPLDLPEGWEWIRLGACIESMTNGIYKQGKFYHKEGIICLRMYNISEGEINFENVKRMIIEKKELKQYRLISGDILVNRVNSRELVGKAAVIPELSEPIVFESKNIRVRLLPESILPKYANIYFRVREVRAVFEGDAKQTCGQASISQPQISGLVAPLPPLPEQHRIVAKVDELMEICDALKARLNDAQATRFQLADAIVEQAIA